MPLKQQFDALKSQGYSASGYIRALFERELKKTNLQKGRVKHGVSLSTQTT
jgi:mannitol/fructose-specific phosphotransferase system IIA component